MKEILEHKIRQWLASPIPLWSANVSSIIIELVFPDINSGNYSIQHTLTGIYDGMQLRSLNNHEPCPLLELPSSSIKAFYDKHDLNPIELPDAVFKLNSALEKIKLVHAAYIDITLLVKTIQVIQSEQLETDVSYSHPDIPFSIFISLCKDVSSISNFRVAESILHEAMHLKLTLVERLIPLIEMDSKSIFYSPWRDDERPVRGVLHGLFVFCAIFDFFQDIKLQKTHSEETDFIDSRINQIKKEIGLLVDFPHSSGLTSYGKELAKSLLYNVLQQKNNN